MGADYLHCDAFLLQRKTTSDLMERLSLFTAEKGLLWTYRRIRKKSASTPEPDLFDRMEVVLEARNSSWFLKETHIKRRFHGIGGRYSSLVYASRFVSTLLNNPFHDNHATGHFENLGSFLEAWERGKRPEVVYFKSLYLFAREEGLPVKEDWWARLSEQDRGLIADVLKSPIDEQAVSCDDAETLVKKLEAYLETYAEVRFEPR